MRVIKVLPYGLAKQIQLIENGKVIKRVFAKKPEIVDIFVKKYKEYV